MKDQIVSRKEALSKGLTTYFTGKSCKQGHVSERRTSNCHCVTCSNISTQNWRLSNKEYANNWWKNHPEKRRAKTAKRNAAKIQAIPKWADLDAIREIYENVPEGHEVDHIIPLQGRNVCGLHCENNLQYLTAEENRRKSNSWI